MPSPEPAALQHTQHTSLVSRLRTEPGRSLSAYREQDRAGQEGLSPALAGAGSEEGQPQVLGKSPVCVATGACRAQKEPTGHIPKEGDRYAAIARQC